MFGGALGSRWCKWLCEEMAYAKWMQERDSAADEELMRLEAEYWQRNPNNDQ